MSDPAVHVGIIGLGGLRWLGGVQYTNNLVRALMALEPSERPNVTVLRGASANGAAAFATADGLIDAIVPERSRVHPKALLAPVLSRTPFRQMFHSVRPWLGETDRERFGRTAKRARQSGVDVLFPVIAPVGRQGGMKWVGWWPDFQHRDNPEFYSAEERLERDGLARGLADEAPLLIASSETVRRQYEEFFPSSRGRVRVLRFRSVLSGSDITDPATVAAHYGIEGPYFVVANQFWKHKNHLAFINAFAAAREREPRLRAVFTGLADDYRFPDHPPRILEAIEQRHLRSAIHVLGVIPRPHLLTLMAGSVAVVQPSLAEGWSTVVEDARAVGAPVLLSDIPVHREQAPCGTMLFDPRDVDGLAECLQRSWPTSAAPFRDVTSRLEEHMTLVREYAGQFVSIAVEAARA